MRRAGGLNRLRRASCGLALVALLAGAIPAAASAHTAQREDVLTLRQVRKWGLKRAPALTPMALYQVRGRSVGVQFAYLTGAVLGYQNYNACLNEQFARKIVEAKIAARAHRGSLLLFAIGLTPATYASTFLDGVAYGCTYVG